MRIRLPCRATPRHAERQRNARIEREIRDERAREAEQIAAKERASQSASEIVDVLVATGMG